MNTNNVHKNENYNTPHDALTEALHNGAAKMLQIVVEAEVEAFCDRYRFMRDEGGRRRIVRNGYLPARKILTGIGEVLVKVPRTRDRLQSEEDNIVFTSSIIPPYLRKSTSLEVAIPWLYLRGVSTKDHAAWQSRSLADKRYVYFWADGIHMNVRMDKQKLCLLVIIGATADGTKEIVAIEDGFRESTQSWRELLLDLKHRGLTAPELAVADGAMGFWRALTEVYSTTRAARCWVHKTKNILNRLPKSVQKKAKSHLVEIYTAETRREAEYAFRFFINAYEQKYPKAVEILTKDKEELLAFYDFPAAHWIHSAIQIAVLKHQPDRIHVCYRTFENGQDERVPEPGNGARDGVPIMRGGSKEMAQIKCAPPVATCRKRNQIHRWNHTRQDRCLNLPYTTFGHSSIYSADGLMSLPSGGYCLEILSHDSQGPNMISSSERIHPNVIQRAAADGPAEKPHISNKAFQRLQMSLDRRRVRYRLARQLNKQPNPGRISPGQQTRGDLSCNQSLTLESVR